MLFTMITMLMLLLGRCLHRADCSLVRADNPATGGFGMDIFTHEKNADQRNSRRRVASSHC